MHPLTHEQVRQAIERTSVVFQEALDVIPADADWMAFVAVNKVIEDAGLPVFMSGKDA